MRTIYNEWRSIPIRCKRYANRIVDWYASYYKRLTFLCAPVEIAYIKAFCTTDHPRFCRTPLEVTRKTSVENPERREA